MDPPDYLAKILWPNISVPQGKWHGLKKMVLENIPREGGGYLHVLYSPKSKSRSIFFNVDSPDFCRVWYAIHTSSLFDEAVNVMLNRHGF